MFARNRSTKKARKSSLLAIGGGLLAAFIAVFLALAPVPKARAATTVINICGQNTTNPWNILGGAQTNLRAKLDNPANFGPSGTYGDFDFNYVDVGNNFTEATIRANACNIWFSGFEHDSTYTPTELTELSNWVANTNGQVFAGCDASSYDPVCDLLGFTVTNDTDSYGFVVQQLINPITCDGALTPADQLQMAGGAGAYFTGPGVTPTNVLAVHETGGVADPAKPIIVYTGDFFLTSDIDMVSTYTLTSGGGVTNNNDIMAVNAFSALADVSVGNDICSSAGPQVADLTITKATNPAGGTDFPFVLDPDNIGFLAKWGSFGSGNGQFDQPIGVAVDGSGNVYVADTNNHRIQKFDAGGAYLAQWGGPGTGNGQFNYPSGVVVDGSGNVYVADTGNFRIQKFDAGGIYQTQWGSFGSGNGQFSNPHGMAIDGSGNIYVADTDNHRIQKFDGNGAYLGQWGGLGSGDGQFINPLGVAVDGGGNVYVADYGNRRIQKFDGNGNYLSQWGGYGSGNGQFNAPYGVVVDGGGNVYAADTLNHRIQMFDGDGAYLTQWGGYGAGNGQFNYPLGVAVDGSGNVYVLDFGNNRIQKFGPRVVTLDDGQSHTFTDLPVDDYKVAELVPDGWTLDDIDCGSATATRTDDTISVTLAAGDDVTCVFTNSQTPVGGTIEVRKTAAGGGNTQFEFDLSWVNTNLFLADGGSFVTAPPLAPGVYFITEVNLPTGWTQQSATCDNAATTPVETGDPVNLIVADGDAWVCTFTNVYTPPVADLTITKATNPAGGTDFPFVLDPNDIGFLAQWGSNGTGNSQFGSPVGVAVDGNGNVYVVDSDNHRIQKFDAGGAYLDQWGSGGSGNGQFYYPQGVAVDGDGNVYVADLYNNRIQKFAGDGTFLMAFGWDVVSGNVDTDFEICQSGDTCKDGSPGSGDGQFSDPVDVAVDGAGNVYVADSSNHRIQKFDSSGNYLSQWGSFGSGNGQFNYPNGVAVDGAGNVYVTDSNNHRIQKFDGSGNYLIQWGGNGSGNGQFHYPQAVAADGAGNVYVADSSNNRIQKFDAGGVYQTQWGSFGSGNGQFQYPAGVAVDGAGNVYVADLYDNRVQKFGPVSVTLDDGQSHTFSGLPAGDHTVAELVPDGWTLDDIDCGSATATRDGDAISITLAAGDDVTCVFTNVQYGTITVIKQAGDVGDEFEFDPSWSNDNFLLGSGGAETSDPLPAGTYSVAEVNLMPGWSLDSATCDNMSTTPVETTSPASIPVADGDEWVCTFTNIYTPPPTNICNVQDSSALWTDIIGKGMGNTRKHKAATKLAIPNYAAVDSLYGQMVAKNTGLANYVRFILPGKNNYVQVNAITSPAEQSGGNFWYGDYIDPAKSVTGRWFLQGSGAKNHIPRALVLYPTYESATNTYVNVWNTYDAAEGEAYWDTAGGWTQERVIVEPIAPPNGPTTFNVELAVVDNDKDARPIWVTVEAGGVTQTQMPNNPNAGDELNLMTFTLANVPAGTDEITITVYSPSMAADGVVGDSAALVGMAANYMCAPIK